MDRKREFSEEEQPRKKAAIEESDSEHSEQSERESGEQSSPSQQSKGSQSSKSSKHESEAEDSWEQSTTTTSKSNGSSSAAEGLSDSSSTKRKLADYLKSSDSSSNSHSTKGLWSSSSSSSSSQSQSSTSSSNVIFLDNYDTDYLRNLNYLITRKLGSGAYGHVYQATNTQTNQTVAIKILKTGKGYTTLPVLGRLTETTQKLIDMRHRNIVAIYSSNRIAVHQTQFVYRLYICTELTELPDLFQALQITNNLGNDIWWPLDEQQSRHIIKGIASGLRHMHSNGMSHSDLKLDNVLLFWSNTATQQHRNASMNDILTRNKFLIYELIPKLTDFDKCGIRRDDDPEGKIMVTNPRTQECYAAPECFRGERYDLIKADCYSVGCCLMSMLLASHPFDDKTFEGISSPQDTDPLYREKKQKKLDHCNRMKGDVSYIRHLIKHLSPQLMQVLERLLDPNSDSRITIEQFLADQWFTKRTETIKSDFGRTYLQDV